MYTHNPKPRTYQPYMQYRHHNQACSYMYLSLHHTCRSYTSTHRHMDRRPDWQPNVRSQYSVPLQYKLSSQYESVGVCTQPVASQVSTVHATASSQSGVFVHTWLSHTSIVHGRSSSHSASRDALHTTICAVTILARITIIIVRQVKARVRIAPSMLSNGLQ